MTFLTKRQHKGFGILFFIWGIGAIVIALMCPFLIKAGVNNKFNAGGEMTKEERDQYLHNANLLLFIALGVGGFLWILSGFNVVSWRMKEKSEPQEQVDEYDA